MHIGKGDIAGKELKAEFNLLQILELVHSALCALLMKL